MSKAAIRGVGLFMGKAGCIGCHGGPLFSDYRFHNISTSPPDQNGVRADDGRYRVTGIESDRGSFLTPSLRSASRTSPYLHDGSVPSLLTIIRHKTSDAGRTDPLYDRFLDSISELTDDEVDDLVQLIKALDGAPIPLDQVAPPMTLPD